MAKYICSIENDKVQLEVFECDCGFHLGLDFTYMDQVDDIKIECPSCKKIIDTSRLLDEEERRTAKS